MMFGRIGMTRPESFPQLFHVYSQETETSSRGRERLETPIMKLSCRCILATASLEEKERYHQMGVLVTHSIVQRGSPVAKENDIFALVKGGAETRRFRVQAVHNKGEMSIDTVFYCEERSDLK